MFCRKCAKVTAPSFDLCYEHRQEARERMRLQEAMAKLRPKFGEKCLSPQMKRRMS